MADLGQQQKRSVGPPRDERQPTDGYRDADLHPSRTEALFWAVALSAMFMVVYGGCNWITSRRSDVGTLYFQWELDHIPLIPLFIIPYMTIDLFFVGSFFICTTRRELHVLTRRIAMAIGVAGACFLLFPLKLGFPRPAVSGWLGEIFNFLRGFDQPYNLAPSLHIALRSILWFVYVAHTSGPLRHAVRGWFILIGVSTLFTWQHQVFDVGTGQLLALACFFAIPALPLAAPGQPVSLRASRPNRRLGLIYGALSVLSLVLAMVIQSWAWLLIWPAIALTVVACGYVAGGPGIFRKSQGQIPLSAHVCLAPYFAGSWLSYLHRRRRLAPFVEIVPGVYLGRKLSDGEAESLVGRGVAAVLDLTAEFSQCRRLRELRYENVPILDLTVPTAAHFEHCVAFTQRFSTDGGVFINCALGLSRSALIAAAHLLATGQADSPESAVEMVRRARPRIVIREAGMQALRAYHASVQPSGPAVPR